MILSLLFYQVQSLQNFVHSFLMNWCKSTRCFGGLSLISIILWEYCENNIKTFCYYSYGNNQIISQKVVRFFFFFEIILSIPTNRIMFILIRIYAKISWSLPLESWNPWWEMGNLISNNLSQIVEFSARIPLW